MADYHPLIARAVAGLPKNTGEERRALYERARQALVTQLRSVQPALEESEITRERLALEEAIRKVEAESARQAREAARPMIKRPEIPRREEAPRPPAAPRPETASPGVPRPPAAPRPPTASPPPRPPVNRPTLQDEAQKTFRETAATPNLVSEAKSSDQFRFESQPSQPTQPAPAQLPPQPPAQPQPPPQPPAQQAWQPPAQPPPPPPAGPEPSALSEYGQLEPQIQSDLWALPLDSAPTPPPAVDFDTRRPRVASAEEHEEPEPLPRRRPPRSYGRIIRTALVLILIIAIGGLLYWQRAPIGHIASSMLALVKPTGAPPPREAPAPSRPKITDRLGAPQPAPSAGPPVAQRVVLYEEDPDDPQGKRYTGTVIWRTEQKAASPGRTPEIAIRADIEIPDRQFSATWSLRRNSDQSLPASHTIEIVFNLPADSPTGGVQNVPGVLMKQAEQTRGVPLAGLAVKVTPGYFLIGLSALESDVQRNIQLLKERSWFDIPIVYNNNRRAILAMEKGEPGERVFNEAFAAWKQ